MKAKKDIPNIATIKVPYHSSQIEDILLYRYFHIQEQGYSFSVRDFDIFCSILLRRHGLENVPKFVLDYAVKDGKIIDKIRFEMLTLGVEQHEGVPQSDEDFYYSFLLNKITERKAVVKKEIGRVVNNAKSINLKNSTYYRELLSMVASYHDLTLIDWFVPIQLTFERLVHIYVKHVEETKFGEKDFKKRSFFDYKHTEIITLLKTILRQEEEDIKEHFIYVPIGAKLNDKNLYKDYHRGFGKFKKLIFDKNEFRLTIDKNGFIQTFYQNK